MNDSKQNSIQVLWWIEEVIVQVEILSTLQKKRKILTRVLFSYSDEIKNLSYKLNFIAYYIRGEWF